MSNNKLKTLARNMQARNPGMRYTTARRLTKQLPHLESPRDNLIVAGGAGFGATVALKAFAAHAVDEGSRIALLGAKESWGEWLTSKADITERSITRSNEMSLEQNYVNTLLKVQPGTAKSPLFLVLDNFTYVSVPFRSNELSPLEQYGGLRFLHHLIAMNPYTCVAIRVQTIRDAVLSPSLRHLFLNRLWMGRISSVNSLSMFNVEATDLPGTASNRGDGFFMQSNRVTAENVHIPFEPGIQTL